MGILCLSNKIAGWTFKFIIFYFVVFDLATSPFLYANTIKKLSSGKPLHSEVLGRLTFKKIKAYRLKDAEVVYVNREVLQKMGVDVQDLTDAELKSQILDEFAWVTEKSFAPMTSESKSFYVDYYGGRGLGLNMGSGRAMIRGAFQVKGVGITPMFKDILEYDMDGTTSFEEAIKETIWGEFLNRILPHGAGRVSALISYKNELRPNELSFLIVRKSPLRLGHFFTNSYQISLFSRIRTNRAQQKLAKYLVSNNYLRRFHNYDLLPPSLSDREKALLNFSELWLYKISQQMAKTHFQKIYHGASTESNIMLDGGLLDYETASTVAGFDAIAYLPFEAPFANYKDIHMTWGIGVIERLLRNLEFPNDVLNGLRESYTYYWHHAFQKNFLINMGFASDRVSKLIDDNDTNNDFTIFLQTIIDMTHIPNYARSVDIQYLDVPEVSQNFRLDLFMDGLITVIEASYSHRIHNPKKYFPYSAKNLNLSPKALKSIFKLWNQNVEDSFKSMLENYPNPMAYLNYQMMWQNRTRQNLFQNHLMNSIDNLRTASQQPSFQTQEIENFIQTEILNAEPNLKDLNLSRFVPVAFEVDSEHNTKLEVYNIYKDQIEWMNFNSQGHLIRDNECSLFLGV